MTVITNEEALRITDQAITITLDEIGGLKQAVEALMVQNAVFRSILLAMYRCRDVHDAKSQRLLEDHLTYNS